MAWTKEQIEAIEKSGSNIIVSAGAGSGKTAVLSERVIYKLTHGIHIDELLILTFTRAAAEEMKDRIRENIKKKPELKNELDTLDSSYITTFDSFALSVVKKYHYFLNIKKEIEITDESIVTLEKNRIIDSIFERAYERKDEKFEALLKKFTIKNDKPIKNAIESLIKKIDNYIDREEYLNYLKNVFFEESNLDTIVGDFEQLVSEKKKGLAFELQRAYYYFTDEYKSKVDDLLLPIINSVNIEELISYKSIRLPNLPRGTEDETKEAKKNLKNSLDSLIALSEFGTRKKIKEDILETKDIILALVALIEEYYIELGNYKTANDIYTFNDIASLAIKILKEHDKAREELRDKFKEIMIDEYQDTNDVQETFISMIAHDNVYMVGDIKQSIYRFRGSNPSIFKNKYDHYSKGDGGQKIDLIKNFRSRKEVLENINFIFDLLMNDSLGGAEYTVSHEMIYGNTNYDSSLFPNFDYNCEILEYDEDDTKEFSNAEIEVFAIAKDIKEKMDIGFQVFDKKTNTLRPFRYSDAVIILDRSYYFDTFKTIFEYLGIPLTILKEDKLNANFETYLFKNIIDLILRIKDGDYGVNFKYDFLSIGRSFLYEYTDDELFKMITGSSYRDSKLYKDFSNIPDFNSNTINDFLEFILEKTDFYNKLYKVGDYENTNLRIMKLLDMADNLSSLSYTIYDYRDYLNDIIEQGLEIKYTSFVGDVDSVKILTIHKSKGLEYALCYFADLDHSFNTTELKEKFISDRRLGIIAPVTIEGESDTDSVLKLLYKSNFMKEEIGEKIRLFYVALTRAREKFTIVIPKKDTKKLETNSFGTIEDARRLECKSLGDFVYSIKDHLPVYFKSIDKKDLKLSKKYLYAKSIEELKLNSEVDSFEVYELSIEDDLIEKRQFSSSLPELLSKESIDNMKYGTKIHEMLEFIDFKNYDPSIIEDPFIRSKVEALINSDLLKNIVDAKIYQEYEFVYEDDDGLYHGCIDLMVEYEDHIDIIDYKLKHTDDKNYVKQVNGYKKYINSISNKEVKTYLYSIIEAKIYSIN